MLDTEMGSLAFFTTSSKSLKAPQVAHFLLPSSGTRPLNIMMSRPSQENIARFREVRSVAREFGNINWFVPRFVTPGCEGLDALGRHSAKHRHVFEVVYAKSGATFPSRLLESRCGIALIRRCFVEIKILASGSTRTRPYRWPGTPYAITPSALFGQTHRCRHSFGMCHKYNAD